MGVVLCHRSFPGGITRDLTENKWQSTISKFDVDQFASLGIIRSHGFSLTLRPTKIPNFAKRRIDTEAILSFQTSTVESHDMVINQTYGFNLSTLWPVENTGKSMQQRKSPAVLLQSPGNPNGPGGRSKVPTPWRLMPCKVPWHDGLNGDRLFNRRLNKTAGFRSCFEKRFLIHPNTSWC